MGRIRTTFVKRTGQNLLKENPGLFKADFEHNKKLVVERLEIPSKKLRNVIAGYITQLAKRQNKNSA